MRILVVEDSEALRHLIVTHLRERGFAADPAEDGRVALTAASAASYDAMILDLGLPDGDGLDLMRALRAGPGADLRILILTARDGVSARVAGLDGGADDYIVKPVDIAELDARLRAVLRRPGTRARPVHLYEDLSFDTNSREARCRNRALDLTPRESGLFEELIRAAGNIAVRDAMAERLYHLGTDVSANAIEATLSRLRRKLAASGSCVRVQTLRGIGYRLAQG